MHDAVEAGGADLEPTEPGQDTVGLITRGGGSFQDPERAGGPVE
jgi:hypothetical protein